MSPFLALAVVHVLHWPFGLSAKADVLLDKGYYLVGYDTTYKVPGWTVYRLTPEQLEAPQVSRSNDFREDRSIPESWGSKPKDYKKAGYDRGHSAPAGDFSWSEDAMSSTFLMTNMMPQTGKLNRGQWKALESAVRKRVLEGDTAYVFTGVLGFQKSFVIGDGVGIPAQCVKFVVYVANGDTSSVCTVCTNTKKPVCKEVDPKLYQLVTGFSLRLVK